MSNRNPNNRDLSPDQRLLVDNYIRQYNQANNQINHLYTVLGELRYNIATIYNQSSHQLPSSIDRRFNSIYEPYDLSNDESDSSTSNILSISEILSTTSMTRFSSISMPINDEGPIRLERFDHDDMVIQITHCGHIFSCDELMNWFRSNVRCPVCRHNVREAINSAAAASVTQSSNIDNNNNNNEVIVNPTNTIANLINSLFDSSPIINSIIYDLSNNQLFTSNNPATRRNGNRN